MNKRPEHIVVGKFGRPRGLSGEIFINSLTDNPERFENEETFWIEDTDGLKQIVLKPVITGGKRIVVRIEGRDSLEEVKKLTNQLIYIESDQLTEAPEGSYYIFDLIDCEVFDTDNNRLGAIADVEHYPASDIWIIADGESKVMFPAVREFVVEVDIVKKKIVINPPEGLFGSTDEN